ncbi:uncharacterized mitochondrial protein AtMg00240-like [Arachis stenosperma]|uniref:uncharacterized mitochondrial protein AtMg00240-like n=1 Tax=Arachis stenosperma TaxID=217475 RepID=UPI0025ACD919|nr:uncharacterized mitochondrial protein AtMg00240-like [Arachis stenosperma]
MNYTAPLSKYTGLPLSNLTPYRRLIGRLLYLTNTRPDISFAVNKLSQYLDCSTNMHCKVGLHILKYIKGTPTRGILFSTTSDLCLTGYSDSDWGTCPDTWHSVADILTKSLAPGPFAKIHCKLGMHVIHIPSLREADRRKSSS